MNFLAVWRGSSGGGGGGEGSEGSSEGVKVTVRQLAKVVKSKVLCKG